MKKSTRKQYRIVLAEPGPSHQSMRGNGPFQRYLTKLLAEHPGQWALFSKNQKHLAYLYQIKKKTAGMEMKTVSNGNGTFQVFIKMNAVEESVPAQPKKSVKSK
jgi:hypothetical protein